MDEKKRKRQTMKSVNIEDSKFNKANIVRTSEN